MKKIDAGGGKHYFACGECPIVEEFEYRMRIAEEHPEWGGFQFDHCACDKVGDEFFMCGYCEDAWKGILERESHGRRKSGRAYRRKMQRKKDRQMKMNAKYRAKRNPDIVRALKKAIKPYFAAEQIWFSATQRKSI